jgi:hypothetical protein
MLVPFNKEHSHFTYRLIQHFLKWKALNWITASLARLQDQLPRHLPHLVLQPTLSSNLYLYQQLTGGSCLGGMWVSIFPSRDQTHTHEFSNLISLYYLLSSIHR